MNALEEKITRWTIGALAVALTMCLALIALGQPTIPPCESEDSNNGEPDNTIFADNGQATACLWDASERGNGQGSSFVAFPDGSVEFLD